MAFFLTYPQRGFHKTWLLVSFPLYIEDTRSNQPTARSWLLVLRPVGANAL